MKKNLYGSSIIETLIIVLIVVMGVTGAYEMLNKANIFSRATGNRIQAIQIAREGIEAMINIRDTNALLFSGDYKNCWNALNYNTSCINSNGSLTDIQHNSYYTVYQDVDNRWKLALTGPIVGAGYTNSAYRTQLGVNLDANGLYAQNSGTPFAPYFTRKIYTQYIDTDGNAIANTNDEKIRIVSTVEWSDTVKQGVSSLSLETTLTNWKSKF